MNGIAVRRAKPDANDIPARCFRQIHTLGGRWRGCGGRHAIGFDVGAKTSPRFGSPGRDSHVYHRNWPHAPARACACSFGDSRLPYLGARASRGGFGAIVCPQCGLSLGAPVALRQYSGSDRAGEREVETGLQLAASHQRAPSICTMLLRLSGTSGTSSTRGSSLPMGPSRDKKMGKEGGLVPLRIVSMRASTRITTFSVRPPHIGGAELA